MKNKFLFLGAASGFFCIAFGAFAAHALEKTLSAQALDWIDTGLTYQMFHTLALVALGFFQLANQNPPACRATAFNLIGLSWASGILLFSGSLYGLALTGLPWLVWCTPLGGLAFLFGWAVLIFLSLKGKRGVKSE